MGNNALIPSTVDPTLIQSPHMLRARSDILEVWRFDLDTSCPDENAERTAWLMLDAGEQERASSFIFAHDRRRFIAGRSLLRTLLGRYLGIAPDRVRFQYSPVGKPFLDLAHGAGEGLSFNLSHSERVCYVAVLASGQVGIDVELDRTVDDIVALGRTVFSAREMTELQSREGNERNQAFLRGWTRKEAVVKLLGTGLGIDLQGVTVGLGTAEMLVAPIAGISDSPLRVCTLPTRPGEYVAVAYTGRSREIVVHQM